MKKLLAVLAILISSIAINAQIQYDTTQIGIDGFLYSENASTTFEYGVNDTAYFYLNPPKHWTLYYNFSENINYNCPQTFEINRICFFDYYDNTFKLQGEKTDIHIDISNLIGTSIYDKTLSVNNTYEFKISYKIDSSALNDLRTDTVIMNFYGVRTQPVYGLSGGNTINGIEYENKYYYGYDSAYAEIKIIYTISNTTGIKITSVSTNLNNSNISLINNNLIVDYTSSKAEFLPLYIFNTAGQLVYQNNISVNAGENHFENLVNLENGMYVCKFGSLLQQRIIKF